MMGAVVHAAAVTLPTIRAEGRRLHYEGDALEDFVDIIAALDDYFVELDVKKQAAALQTSITRLRNRGSNG
jgi:hypothetical protein